MPAPPQKIDEKSLQFFLVQRLADVGTFSWPLSPDARRGSARRLACPPFRRMIHIITEDRAARNVTDGYLEWAGQITVANAGWPFQYRRRVLDISAPAWLFGSLDHIEP